MLVASNAVFLLGQWPKQVTAYLIQVIRFAWDLSAQASGCCYYYFFYCGHKFIKNERVSSQCGIIIFGGS